MKYCDIVIIGGGPSGLSAAIEAKKQGIDNILILEKEGELGGALNQSIHNGFWESSFGEELTGPEYAQKFLDKIENMEIAYRLNTMVIDLTFDKVITAVNCIDGVFKIKCKAVIAATGCKERARGYISIPENKYAGIFTVGSAQKFVNNEGYMPGKEVIILGSGNVGLVMARRMALEGAIVKAVVESLPYPRGNKEYIEECIEDFNIPMKLGYTVAEIKGRERIESVTVAEADESGRPIKGTEEIISCDTLLVSVGLMPENELLLKAGVKLNERTYDAEVDENMQTSIEGIFACGNAVSIHDFTDEVNIEGETAGKGAAMYLIASVNKD